MGCTKGKGYNNVNKSKNEAIMALIEKNINIFENKGYLRYESKRHKQIYPKMSRYFQREEKKP